jgi:hypothetical protein
MGCNCNCHQKDVKPAAIEVEKKTYLCAQCNTFKEVSSQMPAPECCGKKMQDMD